MELLLGIVSSSVVTAFVTWIFTRKKTNSETELNEVRQAQGVLEMARATHEEARQFYEMRVHLLEEDMASMKKENQFLREMVMQLQRELIELKKGNAN
jgi:MinD-like ATPase involved in chromosome partitioning or flagellar assembly